MPMDDSKPMEDQLEDINKIHAKQRRDFEKQLDAILVMNELIGQLDAKIGETQIGTPPINE
jgi:hypothetical protein